MHAVSFDHLEYPSVIEVRAGAEVALPLGSYFE